ncbi:SIR2 family protein [Dickeya zeae]|uniref:SIR2 family protein n=1 Tax=Dickeya zeae TaxID=204042 RepID=UPI001C6367AB|nr:SIR2 family protein [Dickeya zeae]
MSKISYYSHDCQEIVELLANCFTNNNLIPIIGSGFTVGCQTKSGKQVPSGTQFAKKMVEIIVEEKKLSDEKKEKIKSKKFSEISDLFFNDDWVNKEKRRKYLIDSFDGAALDTPQRAFIRDIRWPYIYTLNVDDAIENCSDYKIALPYDQHLSFDSKNHPTLYKIHGDIQYEMRHEVSRLIFKRSDYLTSLESNRRMLELLQLDFKEKNIIYIGCSLTDEIDLAFVVAQHSQIGRKQTQNIMFLNEKPDEIDEQDFINMGINNIILFDEGKYEQIYSLINSAYQLSSRNSPELNEFRCKIKKLSQSPIENKEYLLTGIAHLNDGRQYNSLIVPYFYGKRKIEDEITRSLQEKEITIIKGTRVSGRTLLCYSILSNIIDRKIFIVSSNNKLNNHALNRLIGQENSIIFFDSNVLDAELLKRIKAQRKFFKNKKISILLCSDLNNSDEEYFLDVDDSTVVYTLSNKLSENEVLKINEGAIKVSLPTFTTGKYLLEKIFNVYQVLGENNYLKRIDASEELYICLCTIATKYSITGQEIITGGFNINKTKGITNQHSPYLEIERIKNEEKYDHTSFKITSYASSWVVALLREFYRNKGKDWCVDNLIRFLKNTYPKDKSLATSIRKFDNLNHIFTEGDRGAADIIIDLYNRLQEIEGQEPDFYVQKAKAYYNIYQGNNLLAEIDNRIRELNTAFTWAKSSKNLTAERNIIHITALLWIQKMNLLDIEFINEHEFSESFKWISSAIGNVENNSYRDTLLNGRSKSAKNLKKYIEKMEKSKGKLPFMLKYRVEWDELKSIFNTY